MTRGSVGFQQPLQQTKDVQVKYNVNRGLSSGINMNSSSQKRKQQPTQGNKSGSYQVQVQQSTKDYDQYYNLFQEPQIDKELDKQKLKQLPIVVEEKFNDFYSATLNPMETNHNELEFAPFFDGTDYLSNNVDILIYKIRNQLGGFIDFKQLCIAVFDSIRFTLSEEQRDLVLGGEWLPGSGSYTKEFATYRLILRTKNVNQQKVIELRDALLHGIKFVFQGNTLLVPTVLAPAQSLHRLKVIRVSNLDRQFALTEQMGEFIYENVLLGLHGFEKAQYVNSFLRWNETWHDTKRRCPDTRSLYIALKGVSKNNFLEGNYTQLEVGDEELITISFAAFAFKKQLVTDFFEYQFWSSPPKTKYSNVSNINNIDNSNNDDDNDTPMNQDRDDSNQVFDNVVQKNVTQQTKQ